MFFVCAITFNGGRSGGSGARPHVERLDKSTSTSTYITADEINTGDVMFLAENQIVSHQQCWDWKPSLSQVFSLPDTDHQLPKPTPSTINDLASTLHLFYITNLNNRAQNRS